MNTEDFLVILEANGLSHGTNQKSVIIRDAPCCSKKNKLYFFKRDSDAPLFGKCMSCDTTWNSISYLIQAGIPEDKVRQLHNTGVMPDEIVLGMTKIDLLGKKVVAEEKTEDPVFDDSTFYSVESSPDHPASIYAKKRGYTQDHSDKIMIDKLSNSVVYLVKKDGKLIGWQKRFVKPVHKDMKTKSAPGFSKTKHILEFPNNGDLLVCEGPATALSAWHYGFHAVCTFGAAVSPTQIKLIMEIVSKRGCKVGTAFDLDKAGKRGSRNVRLNMYWAGVSTFRVVPEYGNDLNDSWMAGKGYTVVPPEEDNLMLPDLDFEDIAETH